MAISNPGMARQWMAHSKLSDTPIRPRRPLDEAWLCFAGVPIDELMIQRYNRFCNRVAFRALIPPFKSLAAALNPIAQPLFYLRRHANEFFGGLM